MVNDSTGTAIVRDASTLAGSLTAAIHSLSTEVLDSAAADPTLTIDLALALLKRSDLLPGVLEQLSKNNSVMKSRKLKLALVQHPATPRHVSLPMLRHLFTFDLMQVALTPVVPADVKRAANDVLVTRMETVSVGQRLTLARRASGQVAGRLLLNAEARVIHAALENSRLTEAMVVKALMRSAAPAALVEKVSHHAKWSLRREICIALLRNEKTPLARALEFARSLQPALVREILHGSRLPARVKSYLLQELKQRVG